MKDLKLKTLNLKIVANFNNKTKKASYGLL